MKTADYIPICEESKAPLADVLQMRASIAKYALCGLLSAPIELNPHDAAHQAVSYADALIKRLAE